MIELLAKSILTTDIGSDEEDLEQQSHVESTTTDTANRKRKRKAGNMALHDVRLTVKMCK